MRIFLLVVWALASVSAYGIVPKKRMHEYTHRLGHPDIEIVNVDESKYRLNIDPLKWNVKSFPSSKGKNKFQAFIPQSDGIRHRTNMSMFEYDQNDNIVSAAKIRGWGIIYESNKMVFVCDTKLNRCRVFKKEMCQGIKDILAGKDLNKSYLELMDCKDSFDQINKAFSLKSDKIPKTVEDVLTEYKSFAGPNYLRGLKFRRMKISNHNKEKSLTHDWGTGLHNFWLATSFCKDYGYMDKAEPVREGQKKKKSSTIGE